MDRILSALVWSIVLALALWRNAMDPETDHPHLWTYLLILLAGGAGLSLALAHKTVRTGFRTWLTQQQRPDLLLLALVPLAAALVCFHNLSGLSVWYDEDRQAVGSRWDGIVTSAAIQQQPPLDFLLTAGGIRLFGHTATGIRFHHALFAVGSAWLFAALLRRLSIGVWTTAWATSFLVFNTWMIRYAQEGRPYALSLFCGLLHLHALLHVFRTGANRRNWIAATTSGVLFLLAIGMQPVLYLASASLAVLPLWRRPALRRAIIATWLAHATALTLALPLLLLTLWESSDYLNQTPLARLGMLHFHSLQQSANTVTSLCAPFLPVVAATLLAIGIIPALRPDPRSPTGRLRTQALTVLALLCLCFVALVATAFLVLIDWAQHERYFLAALPLVLAVLAMTATILQAKASRVPPIARTAIAAGLTILSPIGLWLQWHQSPDPYSQTCKGEDWQGAFETLRQQAQPGDIAFLLTLNPPDAWSPSGFVAAHFYLDHELEQRVRLFPEWHVAGRTQSELLAELLTPTAQGTPAHAFVATPLWWSRLRLPEDELRRHPWITVLPLANLQFFRITATDNLLDTLDRFFDIVDRNIPDCVEKYRLIAMRLEIHRLRKDQPAAQECLARLKTQDRDGSLKAEIERCTARLAP